MPDKEALLYFHEDRDQSLEFTDLQRSIETIHEPSDTSANVVSMSSVAFFF